MAAITTLLREKKCRESAKQEKREKEQGCKGHQPCCLVQQLQVQQ
jgi:hypothetical protein